MALILRIDQDNGYALYGGKITYKLRLLLNYLNENFWAPKLRLLGYLKHLEVLIEYLDELGIRYSVFFKYNVLAPRDVMRLIRDKGNEIGLHLFSARNFNDFIREVRVIERKVGEHILGFTKHGDGNKKLSRRHAWKYEPEKYILWGLRAGLMYFNGNKHGYKASIRYVNLNNQHFIYIPEVFYIEPWHRYIKASINDIVDHISTGGFTVALVHPCNWFTQERTRRELDKLIEKVNNIISFEIFIKNLNRFNALKDTSK